MSTSSSTIFETERLAVRAATVDDAGLFFALWTNPQVMTKIGFPRGYPITQAQLERILLNQGESEFERLLVVQLKSTGEVIGECKMNPPNEEGIAETDIKLLPAFWGHKYGVEVKRGLLAYLFTHTDCVAVQATPNIHNIASIKMQEAVGGVRVGQAAHEFPESMQEYTTSVHHYIYYVYRLDWEREQST